MKSFQSHCFWVFIHFFAFWLTVNSCSAEKRKLKLDAAKISELYTRDDSVQNFTKGISGQAVIFATQREGRGTPDEKKVVVKLQERGKNPQLQNEIEIYERLQDHYGNLVKHHMLNAISHGSFIHLGKMFDVLILDRAGTTLQDVEKKHQDKRKEDKNAKLHKWPWRTVCKIMTQLLTAVESLHEIDIIHCDIHIGNVIFGAEPEPEESKERKDDVLYDTDVFLFDFGRATNLSVADTSENSRLHDIDALGSLLHHLRGETENHTNLEEMSEEKEKERVLAKFNKLTMKLYDGWQETKNAIDYNAFKKLFETSDTDKKKHEKKHEKNDEKVDIMKGEIKKAKQAKKEASKKTNDKKEGAKNVDKIKGKKCIKRCSKKKVDEVFYRAEEVY